MWVRTERLETTNLKLQAFTGNLPVPKPVNRGAGTHRHTGCTDLKPHNQPDPPTHTHDPATTPETKIYREVAFRSCRERTGTCK